MAELKGKKNIPVAAEEYAETVLNVRRVAKVIKGGKRFAFSALVAVGDKNGKVGIALGKGREVSAAIAKALKRAKKSMFAVPLYKTTIPFTVKAKHGSSLVLLRSASKGTGVIAGGAVRSVMEVLGIKDVLAKSLGSGNPQNVVKATLKALKKLKSAKQIAAIRNKKLSEIISTRTITTKTGEKDVIA
ncbi:MAG: 30S ribosomal protein S5 [candidate division TM6 bacterium GW2011_GWF2_28_16]|nr:MAG: 30S ribosomal protein S5 [candidate division TM6 bacterium GW2011_GWF2_28_16]